MPESNDAERDEFMRTLSQIARDVGWVLERQREHELFQAMLDAHGEAQVRQWLLLQALSGERQAELCRRQRDLGVECQAIAREIEARQRPPLSPDACRMLYRRHGLEFDADDVVNPPLSDSDWLDAEILRRLCEYFAQTPLRG